jgi:hypothetical protein
VDSVEQRGKHQRHPHPAGCLLDAALPSTSEKEAVLEKYIALKAAGIWYKPVNEEPRTLLLELLNNENPPLLFAETAYSDGRVVFRMAVQRNESDWRKQRHQPARY